MIIRAWTIFFATFTLCDFLTINHYVARCFDSDPHLCAIDRHHGDFDIIANS